jgi:hypothetical protein
MNALKVYKVNSVAQAMALAEELKFKGEYDWFRGQAHEWPLCPTLNRQDEESRNNALLRLARFGNWVQSVPEARYLDSDEAILAVAQHYGLPTHFLDFTASPRVAVFFATHEPPAGAEQGFVLCLNTADLNKVWNECLCEVQSDRLPLRFVELHVPDLWRLQAQHGVFLDCPYANVEDEYPVDRIVFPLQNAECLIPEAAIYPDRKSRLEQLLDRYFETERQWATLSWLKEIGQLRNTVFSFPDPKNTSDQLVPSGELPIHTSWSDAELHKWLTTPDESWHRVHANERVDLLLPMQPQAAGRTASSNIRKLFAADAARRSQAIGFTVMLDASAQSSFVSEILSSRLDALWDGLRTLPYGEEELAGGMGSVVQLTMEAGPSRESQQPGSPTWREAARRCFGEVVEIEFGAVGGGGNRACVAVRDLLAAVRLDLDSFLAPEVDDVRADVRRLLSAFRSPRRLFEFHALARLFALQIAPFQVCARTPPFLFTPAGLFTLGLP